MKRLNLGHSDFKNIITDNNYFVDKSMLIEEVINAQKNVLLIPRPRRFGKTLNLSMLRYFFDKNEPNSQDLFTNLNIWKTCEDVKKHCGKYPVINLSFKDAKAETWDDTFKFLKKEISNSYIEHIYLLKSETLFEFEKIKFTNIISGKGDSVDFAVSLSELSEYISRHHNEKVIILIDEYDTPIQAGHRKFYKEVVAFMRNLLSGAFKDNSNLYKGIITGILRVSKESIFSGLNNISVHSILDSRFADKFGFTQIEVEEILIDFNLYSKYDEIKKWYNGYKFGKSENIYNPWSILSYITEFQDGFKTFWSNTSANELIKDEIKKKDAGSIREELLKLINNGTVIKNIEENFIFPDLDTDEELLWTLLTYSGYLTTKSKISDKKYELIIPNFETKKVFQDIIIKWLRTDIRIKQTLLENTSKYLIENNIEAFENGFKHIIGDTFSYYDTAKNNEYIYHSYILGLLAIIGDDYIIKSNRESGEGRYDIILIPHNKSKNGVVIEIKQIEKQYEKESEVDFRKRINKEIQFASFQIDRNKYYKELLENKLSEEQIIKIPIVFAGKEPHIIPIKE